VTVWSIRALAPIGALTIFAGTVATAAGPHAGGSKGQLIHRLHFKGTNTLTWVVHRHATIAAVFGVLVIAVWLLQRRPDGPMGASDPLTVLAILLAAQGLVGSVQYELQLPTDLVWVHVTLATLTWITILWAVAAAGRLVPKALAAPAQAQTLTAAAARQLAESDSVRSEASSGRARTEAARFFTLTRLWKPRIGARGTGPQQSPR
jgi:cytochrome c oxidase assembly protein subunit 15